MTSSLRYRIGLKKILELLMGDITDETTDAIVNAANSTLLGGGGVDGAIHHAAGPQLLEECRKIRAQRGTLPPGQAVHTSGANLKARYVIHTVGPIWYGGESNEPETLASCYRESLRLANELECASISFPSISTGAFGYPVHDAAQVALRTVVEHLHQPGKIQVVRFVLFDSHSHSAYKLSAENLKKVSNLQIRHEL
jgi:O-acetyl-ADP-ribose deacetylase (regulator of RNase III)